MKNYFLLFAAIAILTSCSNSFYQVYTMESQSLIEKENALCYENDDLKIKYNIWAENGDLRFSIENKTEKNIFVSLPKSFLIKNGLALDYFLKREFSKEASVYLSGGSSIASVFNNFMINTSEKGKITNSSKVTYNEMDIICIPPKSHKVLGEYSLFVSHVRDCDLRIEFPKNSSKVMTYNKDNSLLVVTNRISYAFDDEVKDCKVIENDLWMSSVDNYSRKAAVRKLSVKPCKTDIEKRNEEFKIYSPKRYYQKYSRTK